MKHRLGLMVCVVSLTAASGLGCGTGELGPSWLPIPGTVEPVTFEAFRHGRQCWVSLPAGYYQSTARYPVLYWLDGNIVFDQNGGMHVQRMAEMLVASNAMSPVIIVAIDAVSKQDRYADYSPWRIWFLGPGSGRGDQFLEAVVDTLMPCIDARYRTMPGRENTGIIGESLGGLLAVYAFWRHPDQFGLAGAIAPTPSEELRQYIAENPPPPAPRRLYLDTSTGDINNIDGLWEVLSAQGLSNGDDAMVLKLEGGSHTALSWATRVPGMLRFLLNPAARIQDIPE